MSREDTFKAEARQRIQEYKEMRERCYPSDDNQAPDYGEYDETYNVMLEALHCMVEDYVNPEPQETPNADTR
jgi:hypothetical protein